MVQSQVRAHARAERHYRLLSCPGSTAAEGQLGAALAAEYLVQTAAEGAARQHTAAAAISGEAATKGGSPQQQQTKGHIQYIVNKLK